jgi:choline dehydrogenase-like flavoprotein
VIHDLDRSGTRSARADVLVIGGGTVGLVVASALADRGRSVVVVESGGMQQMTETHLLNEVSQTRAIYAGATLGRFRCLGGTSTRWGGALIPFSRADCRADEWPIDPDQVLAYVSKVEALFGLGAGTYAAQGVLRGDGLDFCARAAKWPSFKNRNVAALLDEQLRGSPNLQVWVNATATDFQVTGGSLSAVTARSASGGDLHVLANEVVIAAGAIETTRLLLLLDQQNGRDIFEPDGQLGRFFSDHLSIPVAEVRPSDRNVLNMRVGFRFDGLGGAMRNVRFELTDGTSLRNEVPPCFAHIAFDDAGSGAFVAVRELYRSLQRRQLPSARLLARLATAAPWLTKALWWRFAKGRLLYPKEARIQLHMVIEQAPRRESAITLSSSRTDIFGRPLAEISWEVASEDVENLKSATQAFFQTWDASDMRSIAQLAPYPTEDFRRALAHGGGIFHPVGSVRMAKSPSMGVVDENLRPFRLKNVSVVSTAVLPRSGGCNPTMMLLCFGLRNVDHIEGLLRGKAGHADCRESLPQ